MMRRVTKLVLASSAAVASALLAVSARAQVPRFDLVGFYGAGGGSRVYGLSADGRVAAGFSNGPAGSSAFTWTREGGRYDFRVQEPGTPSALVYGISGDGSTVVGIGGGGQAFRWQGPGTYQGLGILPNYTRAFGESASNDGSIVVGRSSNIMESAAQAIRWTSSTGMQGLGYTRPNSWYSTATGISRNGNTVVGWSSGAVGTDAFIWTASGGLEILPQLPGTPLVDSTALAVNVDGSIVVGTSGLLANATMWRNGQPMDLGSASGFGESIAKGVNDDGSVVVGDMATTGGSIASVWTPAHGMEPLFMYLNRFGATVPSGWFLYEATAVSADGLTVAGWARSDAGQFQGFVATIPTPGPIALWTVTLGACTFRRRRRRRH
jgi:uncharacterized membrane protein